MQLVAYGAQDIYLTGNPQITFFKVVYRRHTNFAMEAVGQTLNGNVAAGNTVTTTISRNGDLVGRTYCEVSSSSDVCPANFGAACINNVVCEIGGQQIDKHYGHWMEVWAELTEPNTSGTVGIVSATDASVNGTLFQTMAKMGGVAGGTSSATGVVNATVPLQFWFCRNPGLALPLIALQYHEVKLKISFSSVAGTGTNFACEVWSDYIYLDTDERRRFAQVSHEYLIEQVQSVNTSGTKSHDLTFNHPVKELVWTGDGTNGTLVAPAGGATKLVLNGHDRMHERAERYFTQTQVWQHHTGAGGLDASGSEIAAGAHTDTIAVYSFALKPEEHQPSGTCNFSRIDNAQLKTDVSASLNIYAVNYNVLRVMSGMGGLAYSN